LSYKDFYIVASVPVKVDRLRALTKWVATGGHSATGIIVDSLSSSITSIPAGFFLLFDPDTQVTNTDLP